MCFEEWLGSMPASIAGDSLWRFETYRKALYLSDLAWSDCGQLISNVRGKGIAWQMLHSAGSISANIEEGYGRGFGNDYARFLRISLGSARETRGWYFRARHLLDPALVEERFKLLDEIIAGLVTTANQKRRRT